MKKILAIALLLFVTACASNDCGKRDCARPVQQQPVQQQTRCGSGCSPQVRTTYEPVEVMYKRTTYKTVYEPKTYQQVDYEKRPYSCNTGCPR